MTAKTDANGVETTFEYDKDYRLTLETVAPDSLKSTAAYSYDANGNETGEIDKSGGAVTSSDRL